MRDQQPGWGIAFRNAGLELHLRWRVCRQAQAQLRLDRENDRLNATRERVTGIIGA